MDTDKVTQITPYLIAYHARQDRAKKLTIPGYMARELASYHVQQMLEAQRKMMTEAARLGILKGIRSEIRKLIKQARNLHGDELRKVGARIEQLSRQAEEISPLKGYEA